MKKYLVNLLYFTLAALIVYPILVFTWGKAAPARCRKNLRYREASTGQLDLRLKDADTTKNIDLLILGSSHAYRGYDPRIFKEKGIKIFNLGSSAQTPIQTEILFDKYIDQFNPKYVIIDVYPSLLQSNGVESSLDLIANKCVDGRFLPMYIKQKNIMVLNSALYTIINNAIQHPKPRKRTPSSDTYVTGGFTESYKKYKGRIRPQNKFDVRISSDQMNALQRTINKIKKRSLGYTLIQSPVTSTKYHLVKNNKQIDEKLAKLGSYYNFNTMLSLSNQHFFDDHHLNQYGVDVFNQVLLKTVQLSSSNNSDRTAKL